MLESIALALAIIDFTGLSPKLEVWFQKARKLFARYFDFFHLNSNVQDNLEGYGERVDSIISRIVVIVLGGTSVVFFIYGLFAKPPAGVETFHASTVIGEVILLVICYILLIPVSVGCAILFWYFLFLLVGYLAVLPAVIIFRLLSIPRRGVVGTIALVVAAAAFIERVL